MYVKVMAAVIACILMSGETHSTSATIPATENQSWFKKRKKKPEQEEKTKSDYEKLVEGSIVPLMILSWNSTAMSGREIPKK